MTVELHISILIGFIALIILYGLQWAFLKYQITILKSKMEKNKNVRNRK